MQGASEGRIKAVIVIEVVELDRRTPGQALNEVIDQLPEPRPNVSWDDSDPTCQRVLTWLRSQRTVYMCVGRAATIGASAGSHGTLSSS